MRFVFLSLLLSACAAQGTGPVLPLQDHCNGAAYADLIGQPATALETVLILAPVRVVRPGMAVTGVAVTMDYLENRINFHISETDTITRISCG